MIFLTGDTHRDFDRVEEFCEENGTTVDDVLIILGDAGINYYLDRDDEVLKAYLSKLPITLFMLHGNHEERPGEIGSYEETLWRGGIVYWEPDYPNLLFAKDGEIYDFDGKKTLVIGGAYSVDKYYRLRRGLPWFETEQPDEGTMEYVERQLDEVGWRVDCVLTHTAPASYEPTWAFIPGLDQSLVDKTTEKWLDSIERRLSYNSWYCGHYHVESQEVPVRIMYQEFEELE